MNELLLRYDFKASRNPTPSNEQNKQILYKTSPIIVDTKWGRGGGFSIESVLGIFATG